MNVKIMRKLPVKKLIFFVTEDWYFVSHRINLALDAINAGYDVVLVTRISEHVEAIQQAGIKVIPFENERKSINPFSIVGQVIRLIKIYRNERPDIIHHVALKTVILGTIASLFCRKSQVVNAITGLGWLYTSKGMVASVIGKVVSKLLPFLLNRSHIIVQNPDDRNWLVKLGVLESKICLIRGSGVDIKAFMPNTAIKEPVIVVLVARMLWDKGVKEFVEAANILKQQKVEARFILVGDPDPSNRASVPEEKLEEWNRSGVVEWWGRRSDVAKVLSEASIACLPSYREGLPKSLLEAASSGLPIVTTDVPGCREVVSNGVNGFLVPANDFQLLAEKIHAIIDDKDLRDEMGKESRRVAEQQFSIEKVNSETLTLYQEAASQ